MSYQARVGGRREVLIMTGCEHDKEKTIWVPFMLQVKEMKETMSFKMGVRFAILYEIRGGVDVR